MNCDFNSFVLVSKMTCAVAIYEQNKSLAFYGGILYTSMQIFLYQEARDCVYIWNLWLTPQIHAQLFVNRFNRTSAATDKMADKMADGQTNVPSTAPPDAKRRMSSSADQQTTILKAEYVTRLQRQSSAPRCNPYAILILVTSLGLAFIGLTMTLVSHWPGATSAGGENPLRVAGPSLLGLGGAVFVLSIIVIAAMGRLVRKQWERNLTKLVHRSA